jgi:cobalt/nickel transport system permease protein
MNVQALSSVTMTGRPVFYGAVDPRARIIATLAFAATVAFLNHLPPIGLALAIAVAAALASGLALRPVLRRLLALEGFMLVLLIVLPFSVPGQAVMRFGPLVMSVEGLALAVAIALKANAIVIAILSQLGTLEPVHLGHGLAHLGVPRKLVALLLLTVRYIAVFQDEYGRLRRAMRARGFQVTSSRHSWRSLGWLVGMLLVRSNDRGNRVLQAMKCRGFTGRFPILDNLRFAAQDGNYLAVAAALICLIVIVELI